MPLQTFTLETKHELYSLDYRTDSKLTWKQISRWSYGKEGHDIGNKNKIHTVVHLRVKDKGPKSAMLVEMNFQSTSTALPERIYNFHFNNWVPAMFTS